MQLRFPHNVPAPVLGISVGVARNIQSAKRLTQNWPSMIYSSNQHRFWLYPLPRLRETGDPLQLFHSAQRNCITVQSLWFAPYKTTCASEHNACLFNAIQCNPSNLYWPSIVISGWNMIVYRPTIPVGKLLLVQYKWRRTWGETEIIYRVFFFFTGTPLKS